MFSWVGAKFDSILSTYVLQVVSALMTAIAPVALTAMTIWVTLYGWAVLRNEVPDTVPAFLWKAFKMSLVLGFALETGVYISNVADSANALATGVASTFLPSGVNPNAITTPYALLDKFNDDASAQIADLMKNASIFRLDLLLATVIFSFGSVIFLCVALFVVTLSKVLLTFVLGIGPLFILCLAWRPTQRFFDSWLSMLLNAIVLTWFAFFALGLSTYMGAAMFKAILDAGGFLGPAFNALGEATRYCVLMILMAIICFQAPSLASALTGGAAVQQGIQMIQNALMVSGLRSAGSKAPSAGSGGGVVHRGTGLPYKAGAMVGAGARHAATATAAAATAAATGAGAMARHGAHYVRKAAYRLAALRGLS